MKFSVILAARLRSTRLPAKALLPLADLPLLTFLLRRLKGAALVDQIILATTGRPEDRHLAALAEAEGVRVFQGSESDLIRRTLDACERFGVEYAVRVTGDCPFVDADSLDHCLAQCAKAGSFDLASTKGAFPVGIDFEVLRAASLAGVDASSGPDQPDAADREHLTKYFYDHRERFRLVQLTPPDSWPRTTRAFTVDTLDDYLFCKALAERLGPQAPVQAVLEAATLPGAGSGERPAGERIRYSKPAGDILAENGALLRENDARLERQASLAARLREGGTPRRRCVCCLAPLDAARPFQRRGTDYLLCPACEHVQTRLTAPGEAPVDFGAVYPPLDAQEFASRVERIYRPKLDWAMTGIAALGGPPPQERTWLELGCGHGFFLAALRDAGVRGFAGVDSCGELVDRANLALGEKRAALGPASLADAVRASDAQVLAAFFVLEHLPELPDFLDAVAAKPEGTVLVFSVPFFGLAAVLEDCSDRHFARSLDGWVHAQMFTEKSLRRCLELAGCEMAGQWMFGQDALDLGRMCALAAQRYPAPLRQGVQNALTRMADATQQGVDRAHFADARHVVAVRRGASKTRQGKG
jgi:spore coat polysaccharide biosynthesis protein SpsF